MPTYTNMGTLRASSGDSGGVYTSSDGSTWQYPAIDNTGAVIATRLTDNRYRPSPLIVTEDDSQLTVYLPDDYDHNQNNPGVVWVMGDHDSSANIGAQYGSSHAFNQLTNGATYSVYWTILDLETGQQGRASESVTASPHVPAPPSNFQVTTNISVPVDIDILDADDNVLENFASYNNLSTSHYDTGLVLKARASAQPEGYIPNTETVLAYEFMVGGSQIQGYNADLWYFAEGTPNPPAKPTVVAGSRNFIVSWVSGDNSADTNHTYNDNGFVVLGEPVPFDITKQAFWWVSGTPTLLVHRGYDGNSGVSLDLPVDQVWRFRAQTVDDSGATRGCYSEWSDPATVIDPIVAPTISHQPTVSVYGEVGSWVASSWTAASGNPTPTYQWQKSMDSGTTWNDVDGFVSAGWDSVSVTLADDGTQFRVVVSNSEGTVTSDTATMTVTG